MRRHTVSSGKTPEGRHLRRSGRLTYRRLASFGRGRTGNDGKGSSERGWAGAGVSGGAAVVEESLLSIDNTYLSRPEGRGGEEKWRKGLTGLHL